MGKRGAFYQIVVFSALLACATGGCAAVPLLVVGAAGAVGGYMVSPDTVEGSSARSYAEVWDAAKEITGIMGTVESENQSRGEIVARINNARITVTITNLNASTTKLSIKARKSFIPKVDIAQDVYTKIIKQMEQ